MLIAVMLNAVMVSVVHSFVATFSSFYSPVVMQNVVVLDAIYIKCRHGECRGTIRSNI